MQTLVLSIILVKIDEITYVSISLFNTIIIRNFNIKKPKINTLKLK